MSSGTPVQPDLRVSAQFWNAGGAPPCASRAALARLLVAARQPERRSPESRRRRRRSPAAPVASSRSRSPAISSVCSTLVGTFGIEPARLGVRGDRLLEEPAVAAGVDEAGEQLGVVAVAVGLAQQPHASRACAWPDVGLEVGVELVRERQARVELERAAERLLGARLAVGARRRCTCRSPGGSGRGAPRPARSCGSSSRQRW